VNGKSLQLVTNREHSTLPPFTALIEDSNIYKTYCTPIAQSLNSWLICSQPRRNVTTQTNFGRSTSGVCYRWSKHPEMLIRRSDLGLQLCVLGAS